MLWRLGSNIGYSMWCLRWSKFGVKSWGQLWENPDEVFCGPKIQHGPGWACPVDNEHLCRRSMEGYFSSLKLSPREHRDLKSRLVTLHMTRLGLNYFSFDEVGLDWGFNAWELAWPQAMYKVSLRLHQPSVSYWAASLNLELWFSYFQVTGLDLWPWFSKNQNLVK